MMLRYILPVLFPLAILGAYSIVITLQYVKTNINETNNSILEELNRNINFMFDEIDSYYMNFKTNSEMRKTLLGLLEKEKLTGDDVNLIEIITNFLSAPTLARPFVHSVYVFLDNPMKKFISAHEGLVDEFPAFHDREWMNSYRDKKDSVRTWTERRIIKRYTFLQHATDIVTIYRRLYNNSSVQSEGVVVLNIFQSYIDNLLNNVAFSRMQRIIMINEDGQVLSGNFKDGYIDDVELKEYIGKTLNDYISIKKRVYILNTLYSPRYRWTFVSIIPERILYRIPHQLIFFSLMLILSTLFLWSIYIYRAVRKDYEYISDIQTVLYSARQGKTVGWLPKRIQDNKDEVIQELLHRFIREDYLVTRELEKTYNKKVRVLQALAAQINPHFVFNTLDSIVWAIIDKVGPRDKSVKMIQKLSDLLHFSLDNSEELVNVELELQNTINYIELQSMRYGFSHAINCEQGIEKVKIMKMLLQPLVENAIYHGIREVEYDGCIEIRLNRNLHHLNITVRDNGAGIQEDDLLKIRERIDSDEDDIGHIGFRNVKRRLNLLYGAEYSMSIHSTPGKGTIIAIQIPVRDYE